MVHPPSHPTGPSRPQTEPSTWATVYLGLGANLGRRRRALLDALRRIAAMDGCRLLQCSRIYETEPEGPGSNWYLNMVASIETSVQPHRLLERLLDLEDLQGRNRTLPWPDRTLDIDILLWEDLVTDTPHLVIPHPRMHKRRFVLVPLAEIDGSLVHPGLDRSITDLLVSAPPARLYPVGTAEINPAAR